MPTFNYIHPIILDSVGVDVAPDVSNFANASAPDGASDTLGHISKTVGLAVPNMVKIGLGNIPREIPPRTAPAEAQPSGYATKLEEVSHGEDTMTNHWETVGLSITEPLDTFFEGSPKEVLTKIEEFSGCKIIREVNKPYSGTRVITSFGEHQMKTGELIIYISTDPVLQIVVHEDIISLDELCKVCEFVRPIILERPSLLGQITAHPYVDGSGNFTRTANRRGYVLSPFAPTVLNKLVDADIPTYGVGKINDIFSGSGITNDTGHNKSNMYGVDTLIKTLQLPEFTKGLSFTNPVDSDAMYDHRRNVVGYRDCLKELDNRSPETMENMKLDNLLLITASRDNDPTYTGTGHTREYIPLLAYGPSFKGNGVLPVGHFADISATIAENFGAETAMVGQSFLEKLV